MSELELSTKIEVTGVTGVTASNGGVSSGYLNENAEVTGVTHDGPMLMRPLKRCITRPEYIVLHQTEIIEGETLKAGVWWLGLRASGGESEPLNVWVCDPLEVMAGTSDTSGRNHGKLLKFKNSAGVQVTWPMPMSMLASACEQARAELLDRGLTIHPSAFRRLHEYLMMARTYERVSCTDCIGWDTPKRYVLPDETFGEGKAIFQNEAINNDFTQSGTLEGWKAHVAIYAKGNPLMIHALCVGLAGPLLGLLGQTGSGNHYYGASSTGKTTLALIAASLYGKPDTGRNGFIRTWRGTDNGFESIAAQRNDNLLVLDEIGEVAAQLISSIIYCLMNGQGKSRSNRSGGARLAKSWRIMLISTGEVTAATAMGEVGKSIRAGHEVRFISIPAARTYGVWDNLNGLPNGAALSIKLQEATQQYYGTAGRAFIRYLTTLDMAELHTRFAALKECFKGDGGQAARVGSKFALCALAGELATECGLLPLNTGDATKAAQGLFNDWSQDRQGSMEDGLILEALSSFLDRHGSSRFSNKEGNADDVLIRDRAGWWLDTPAEGRIWLMLPDGLKEACQGYELKQVLTVLEAAGWITSCDTGKQSKTTKIHGISKKLYWIRPVTSVGYPGYLSKKTEVTAESPAVTGGYPGYLGYPENRDNLEGNTFNASAVDIEAI